MKRPKPFSVALSIFIFFFSWTVLADLNLPFLNGAANVYIDASGFLNVKVEGLGAKALYDAMSVSTTTTEKIAVKIGGSGQLVCTLAQQEIYTCWLLGIEANSGTVRGAHGLPDISVKPAKDAVGISKIFIAHERYAFFILQGRTASFIYDAMNVPVIQDEKENGAKSKYGKGGQLYCTREAAGGTSCSLLGIEPSSGKIDNRGFGISSCEHIIRFIPQTHIDQLGNTMPDWMVAQMVGESQFDIANILLQHPSDPVFAEGTYHIIDLQWYKDNASDGMDTVQKYRNAFPNGIGQNFYELSYDQRYKLGVAGGDLTLLFLGQIKKIYPVATDAKEENEYFKEAQEWIRQHPGQDLQTDPKMNYIAMTRRERLALMQIKEFFSKNSSNRTVTLLFGANHNFKKYPDLFDPNCIETPNAK
ncbi:MAG: hypothetical protein ACXVCP_03080 [Bdellovibrio sp.]